MRLNILAGSLGMFWVVTAYGMPLPLFMQEIQATGLQLGILAAVRQLSMLAQIPSAFFVEQLGNRKRFWAGAAISQRLLWLVPALLPVLWPAGGPVWAVCLILTLGLSDLFGSAATAPWLSWMADLLPAGRAGRFWGLRQRVCSVSVIIGALGAGWLLDAFNHPPHVLAGFSIVFTLAALFGTADILVHLGVHEPAQVPSAPHATPLTRLMAPLRDQNFRRLTMAMGGWSAALALPGYFNGMPGFFNVVYLHEAFGASYSQASWLVLASALGAIVWAPRLGHLVDRLGAQKMACLLVATGPIFTLTWFFVSPQMFHLPVLGDVPQPVLLIGVASLLIGGFYAGVALCQMRMTQQFTLGAGRTVAMAVHWSFIGTIGALGAISGGWIKDHFPPEWGARLVPGGAAFSYFHLLIVLQVLIALVVVLPLLRSISVSEESERAPEMVPR